MHIFLNERQAKSDQQGHTIPLSKYRKTAASILLITFFGLFLSAFLASDWGFYAHRRINRMAIFTLPPELIVFYKKNIEFITEHAIDPDKRRYASKHEAVRHYMDLDNWGTYPFKEVPRYWTDALLKYTDAYWITTSNDTLHFLGPEVLEKVEGKADTADLWYFKNETFASMLGATAIRPYSYKIFFQKYILPQYYEKEWVVDCDTLQLFLGKFGDNLTCQKVFLIDRFSEHGILPYHLEQMLRRLTYAMKDKDLNKILRLSAEMGHYISDAHVPLHTTKNYNGQLTNQIGIHAFWETRLPELYADETYDFFVGKATYIENPNAYFWNIVLESHSLLDSVLLIEKDLSETFPTDRQFCYEERGGKTVRIECQAYAQAYHERLEGMVEQRMRDAILAVGNVWFTAWVNAGQPPMSHFGDVQWTPKEEANKKEMEKAFGIGKIFGRKH